MLLFDEKFYSDKIEYIAGCDEAGRGPLCGPLVVAACILPRNFNTELINDSKKMTPSKRDKAFDIIVNNAIDYSIEVINVETIDEINIYQASKLGMIKAVQNLSIMPDLVITDAMKIDTLNVEVIDIVKGDGKSKNVAAASILAKVTRDRIMCLYDIMYPQYGLAKNKGYGTKFHMEAIEKLGIINHLHRRTYYPCSAYQEKLF